MMRAHGILALSRIDHSFVWDCQGLAGPARGVGGPAPGMMMPRPQVSAAPMMRPPPPRPGMPPPGMMGGARCMKMIEFIFRHSFSYWNGRFRCNLKH